LRQRSVARRRRCDNWYNCHSATRDSGAAEGHCRRKCFDIWETTKSAAARNALERIAAISVIEKQARGQPVTERVSRRTQTATVMEAFFAWIEAKLAKLSMKSNLSEAFRYIAERRQALSFSWSDRGGRSKADPSSGFRP
jgi:hypothetical protein